MKLIIDVNLVEKYCKQCEYFNGGIERLPFNLMIVKCESCGEVDDENCPACTGTLTSLIEKHAPIEVILSIAEGLK
jgi:RNA polymerase subunit RPABC4/transcription elongation factor Spt4